MSTVDDYRLSRPQFQQWLARCRGNGWAHGEDLTTLLRVADNVREADETLRTAEARGLIESTGCSPTLQQKFFGIGGMRWSGKKATLQAWAWHKSTHGWRPVPQKPRPSAVARLRSLGQLSLFTPRKVLAK